MLKTAPTLDTFRFAWKLESIILFMIYRIFKVLYYFSCLAMKCVLVIGVLTLQWFVKRHKESR